MINISTQTALADENPESLHQHLIALFDVETNTS